MPMTSSQLTIAELTTPEAIAESFSLMSLLRPRVTARTYVAEVEHQRREGYRLFAARDGGVIVGLIGIRHSHTLARGEHVFVDDLVTAEAQRGTGIGRQLMLWLAEFTRTLPCPLIALDSRDTAKGFYDKIGFKFLQSIPCMVTPDHLTRTIG
jgi:GNAT superfamily N-acetyltransferase